MKKLILIAFCLPFTLFAQKKSAKGYGFIGAGLHFIEKTQNVAARLNIGVCSPNVGIGLDVQYIRDYGVPILGDFRFISPAIKGKRLTIAAKAGTNVYDKSLVKGGFVYGGELGVIFDTSKNGFYISGQYLSMQYKSKITAFKVNDFGVGIGVKF